tara:strand:+ start:165 stop:1292 length:1128 start_codon:yes stop_codon:yes gene_type:complete
MSISLENLKNYVIKKPFVHYELNVNKRYQQSISDNNYSKNNQKMLLSLVKNIKSISYNNSNNSENLSDISSLSEKSMNTIKSKHNTPIKTGNIEAIDIKISNILDGNKYFIYVPNKKDSFIGSILSIIDIEYCSSSEQSKIKMIKEFREKIGFDIDKNFKTLNYKRKIKKSDVQDILLNNKYTDNNTHIYIGDLINKNIVIIYGMHEYRLINEFDNKRSSIILYYKEGIYCPLLSQDNKNFLDNDTVNQIKKMYSQKTIFKNIKKKVKNNIMKNNMSELIDKNNIKIFGKKNKMNHEDIYVQVNKDENKVYVKKDDLEKGLEIRKKEMEDEIKLIKKMKISELHTIAIKYSIDIYNDKKKKLKKDLMEEIINNIR